MLAYARALQYVRAWRTGAHGELVYGKLLKWQTDYGESAYEELAYGETTSYHNKALSFKFYIFN